MAVPPPNAGATILVVEDDVLIRNLITDILSTAAFAVIQAGTIRQAMEIATTTRPDLVILDRRLPDGDGLESCHDFKALSSRWLPILILTALTGGRAAAQALQQGADDFLGKPFVTDELLARVRSLLRLRHLEEESRRLIRDAEDRAAQLARQTAELEALHHVGHAAASFLDPSRVMNAALDALIRVLPYESASIFRWDPDAAALALAESRPSPEWGQTRFVRGEGLIGWSFEHDQSIMVNDSIADPRFQPRHGDHDQRRSLLVVPLRARGVAIGVLNVSRHRPDAFGNTDLLLTESIAGQVASALSNADLYQKATGLAEKYQALLAGANDAILITDEHERIIEINERATDLLGYTASELIGYDAGDLLIIPQSDNLTQEDAGARTSPLSLRPGSTPVSSADTHARITSHSWRDLLRDGHYFGEVALRRQDGSIVPVELSLSQVDHLGRPLYQGLVRDLTERHRLENQIVRSEKLRALGQMAAGVAHDFNNVLSNILGYIDLLLEDITEPEAVASLRVIERAALDGAQTVRRIQEFTRVRRQTDLVPVDVASLLHDAIEITRPRWRDRSPDRQGAGTITPHIMGIENVMVPGNASELREVLVNLIFNAVDAMPEGGTLTLSTEVDGDSVVIKVQDTGVGMSLNVQQRIFDPFFSTKGPSGSGLGLSVAYGIVARHGGTLDVASVEGQGSTLMIRLPRASDRLTRQTHVDDARPRTAAHILAIDDDPELVTMLAIILSRAGHKVTTLNSGHEAHTLIKPGAFDLVCTDLGMPDVTGWDVARIVHQQAPDIPVVLITGWGDQLEPDDLAHYGVTAVLAKPYHRKDVLEVVTRVLQQDSAAPYLSSPSLPHNGNNKTMIMNT